MHDVAAIYSPDSTIRFLRPLFVARISAGAPSPVDDWIEGRLDLNRYLIRHPAATFYLRVEGDSMIEAGIQDGDILVVDRKCESDDGHIVVARIFNDLTVKRLRIIDGKPWLFPENDAYEPLEITEEMDFEIWGRVTSSISFH